VVAWAAMICGSAALGPATSAGRSGAAALVFVIGVTAALVEAPRAGAEQAVGRTSPPHAVTERRAPCLRFDPQRQAFFGDLHVHTALSQDASTQGTRLRPDDAYRFARGERVGIQPYDDQGRALRHLHLARPLDFAAVTDHAELLGETATCSDPRLPGYESWVCGVQRRWPRLAFFLLNWRTSALGTRFGFCGPGGVLCRDAALDPWGEIRRAAEVAYDRSPSCSFTTFVGYEWTGTREGYNVHRNVLFRNEQVPELPTSFYEARTADELWEGLRRDCVDAPGACEVLAIPHNANLSGGWLFRPVRPDGSPWTAESARARRRSEPLVEVMQHKGDSECLVGGGEPGAGDELCAFEKLPYDGFTAKYVPWLGGEVESRAFVRDALGLGLLLEGGVGANPYRIGMVASTDTHLGAAGAVSEEGFPGHGGAGKPARGAVPRGLPDELEFNPGGLAVLYAEENSRDALFAAMRRREAYGTSGPRIRVRFFGGWDLPEDLCRRHDFVELGYERGVPMGGVLPERPGGRDAPRLALWALQDPGTQDSTGTPLERLQIVKGWVEDGEARERVLDVARQSGAPPELDPGTCQRRGGGAATLCRVWTDPDFDPEQRAFYYARVVQTPTCRWSQRVCVAAGVDCSDPGSVQPGLEPCCAPEHRPVVRERAWTSPVWYRPGPEETEGAP